jgi:hypothetical protein
MANHHFISSVLTLIEQIQLISRKGLYVFGDDSVTEPTTK